MTTVSEMDSFMAMLRSATPEQWLEFMQLQNERGIPLFNAAAEAAEAAVAPAKAAAAPAKAKRAGKAGKAGKAAKVSEAAAAVVAAAGSGHQRLSPSAILPGVCMGRALKADKQYKPHVYRERQCGSACVEGSDLCSKCLQGQDSYAADPSYHKWPGRITEEPFDWVHMMGTAWAEEKKPKFVGSGGGSSSASTASDSGSENGDAEEMSAPAPAPAPATAKPKKVSAAAAAKAAEKAATAAAEKAEKAAARAAEKAEKDAVAAAEKAAKAAAKAAKPVKAAKPAKSAKTTAAVAVPAPVAAAAASAVPEDSEGELTFIKGSNYMVKGDRVYEYNEDMEETGDYVGRLTAFGTIDDAIPEEADAESESETE